MVSGWKLLSVMTIAEVQFLLWENSTRFTEPELLRPSPTFWAVAPCTGLNLISAVTRSSFAFAWESLAKLNRNKYYGLKWHISQSDCCEGALLNGW